MSLLKRFFLLGAGDDPDPADQTSDPDPTAGGDTLDDLLDVEDQLSGRAPPADDEDPAVALKREREASRKKDEDLERERAARRAAEDLARQAMPPPRQAADPEWEAEEERYRAAQAAGKDADYLAQLRWTIDNSRILRTNQRQSQAALWQAQDTADKTAFDLLKHDKPKLYKAYSDRVEKAMAEMRARGQNAPRLAVLRLLVGDDMVNGKLKPKAKERTEAVDTVRVDRGKTPGARSDVRANGSKSEREKRRARLENQII